MATVIIDCVVDFQKHHERWNSCNACGLGDTAAKHVLRPRGYLPCDLLFVGMAPGPSENRLGVPMIGPTMDIIDRWILESGIDKLRWCIQNLTACISRDGSHVRDPMPYEIHCCKPRLIEFVKMANPGQVVLLGELARKSFPKTEFAELQYLHLPHPASLLRGEKKNIDTGLISAKAIVALERFAFGA